MLAFYVGFMVLLNPFALFLYLQPIMQDLNHQDFRRVLRLASFISLGIMVLFLIFGSAIFTELLNIRFAAFRFFGGVVLFSFAYIYIVRGEKALIQIRGDLSDLASDIALPFMVGAGTITLTVLMRDSLKIWEGILVLLAILGSNYLAIMVLKNLRERITRVKFRLAFDKVMEVLLRLNGFFLGAIGIDMIFESLESINFGGMK